MESMKTDVSRLGYERLMRDGGETHTNVLLCSEMNISVVFSQLKKGCGTKTGGRLPPPLLTVIEKLFLDPEH